MDWRLQLFKHFMLTHIPFGYKLRRLKRKFLGYPPSYSNLRTTLENLHKMEASLKSVGRSFEGTTVLEIGSGWFPTIPIMLCVTGAKRVLMTDLNPHMDEVTFAVTLNFLRETYPGDPRLINIHSFADLPISYLSPFDAKDVPDGAVDYVISRTVLEHIPIKDMENLLAALKKKMKPDGLMVHIIDNSDHFEHQDKSLSKVNFLTWSERKHDIVNALQQGGENRLRHHEYPDVFRRAGFAVLAADAGVHEETKAKVKTLQLAARYAAMTPEQVATLDSTYVLTHM